MSTPIRQTSLPVHLWIYNHSFYGISDQIEYFLQAFRQHGYLVSVGRKPHETALNVVIENFSAQTRDVLINFCTRTRKRVAVIMTEHIDFESRRILIHGDPLWSDNDYMHPAMQAERIRCLLSCQPYIRFFMVLGDLPELRNFGDMMIGAETRAIPFPAIDPAGGGKVVDAKMPVDDLVFTGVVTAYRESLLLTVTSMGFSVACSRRFVSRRERDRLNQSAKIVLNIPQREDWRWLSLMRIIAALRCGRATVSIGTSDKSEIAACTHQLDLANQGWKDELKAHVADWTTAYDTMYEAYCQLAKGFEQKCPFPHDMMEFWAITDRV